MFFAEPKLTYLAIFFSCYSIVIWSIDWFRFSVGFFGPSFWALIPQTAVKLWIYLMVRNYKKYNYRVAAPFVVFTLWVSSFVIGASQLFFPKEVIPWPLFYSVLEE